jgi:hypothetical protein
MKFSVHNESVPGMSLEELSSEALLPQMDDSMSHELVLSMNHITRYCEKLQDQLLKVQLRHQYPQDAALEQWVVPAMESLDTNKVAIFFDNVMEQFSSKYPKIYRRLFEQRLMLEVGYNKLVASKKAMLEDTTIRTYSKDNIYELLKIRSLIIKFLTDHSPDFLQAPSQVNYTRYNENLKKLAGTLDKISIVELTDDSDNSYIHPHIILNEEALPLRVHGWTFSKTLVYIDDLMTMIKSESEVQRVFQKIRDTYGRNMDKLRTIDRLTADDTSEHLELIKSILRFTNCVKGAMALMRVARGIESRCMVTETRLFLSINTTMNRLLNNA